jgi:hypothetical protein
LRALNAPYCTSMGSPSTIFMFFTFFIYPSPISTFPLAWSILLFFFNGSTGAWTQGLHFEPLHLLFFVKVFFFWDRVLWTICPGWLRTTIFLISASWVAGITGVNHQHLAFFTFLQKGPGL